MKKQKELENSHSMHGHQTQIKLAHENVAISRNILTKKEKKNGVIAHGLKKKKNPNRVLKKRKFAKRKKRSRKTQN